MSNMEKSWVRICALKDLPADKAVNLFVNGQRLVITRCGDSASILQGYCSHMLYSLKDAKIENCILTCNMHGTQFDVRNGSVTKWATPVSGQDLEQVKARKTLRRYETRVTDGILYVSWPASSPDKVRIRF